METETESDAGRTAVVIGAGIVGICCALYLQRDGHAVTVLDPEPPGEGGASKGNSGIFAIEHCVPDAAPGIAWEVPGMLLHPLGPLTIRWSYLPRALPWLLRFLAASRPAPFEASSLALHAMNVRALEAYRPLVESAGAADIVQKRGWLLIYQSSAIFEKAKALKVELRRKRGIALEVLDGEAVREREPALASTVRHGVYFPDVEQATDPWRLVRVLADDFQRKGGVILRERVRGFALGKGGAEAVHTDAATHRPGLVVLAAGAYSREMARQLGSTVPLDTERGYHAMLPDPGVELRVPVISGDFHCAITPMEGGLRVGGTVEFAGVDAPPNYARADKLLSVARRVVPGLNDAGHTQWMGCRPSLPDSLPVVGRSPRHGNVYFAFGHGQVGLTNAAITGRLVAELAGERPTAIDVAPYRPERF